MNYSGAQVLDIPFMNSADHKYNMSALAPGIYFLKLETKSGITVEQFVITNTK